MLIPFALGSLIGATSLNFLSTLPQISWLLMLLCPILIIVMVGIWISNKRLMLQLWVVILGGILGFVWAYIEANNRLRWELPEQDIQQIVEIEGEVEGITQYDGKSLRFDVQVNRYRQQALPAPGAKVRLYWQMPSQMLLDGDRIRCQAKLKPAWRLANPGGFDQEKQLFIEGVRATGKVLRLEDYQQNASSSLTKSRQHLNDKMAELLQDKPLLGVIQATTLGLYKNITPEQWQVFQATGTMHAVAISGLHVSLVAMLCSGLVTGLVRRYAVFTSLYPAKFYGAIAALLGAVIYSALAGFSIPTERSLAMIAVMLLAQLARQPLLSWHSLALAWLAIAVVDPLSPLQMGFWLSFGCVAALIYGASHDNETSWRKWVVPQIVVFIGLIPLSLFFFGQVAVLSPLANFMVLPVFDFLVIPASLLGMLLIEISSPLAAFCLEIAHVGLTCVWVVLEKIAQIPLSVWQQGSPPLFHGILATLGAIILLAPVGFPGRNWGWIAFLPMIFYQPNPLKQGECRFSLLDVGQGLAAVIQTQNHTLLYDVGPEYGNNADAGQRVIAPFLISQHIKNIDKVIISHGDLDHRGGLKGLANWSLGEIFSGEPMRLPLPSQLCEDTQVWEWDGVKFAILSPAPDPRGAGAVVKKRNDHSCVLKVWTPHHSILLTGDIERSAERKLLESAPQLLRSDILVVPHHGSLSSSSDEFVRQVSPQYALYPVGLGNHYGFPKSQILQRYAAQGSQNLNVSQTGALIFHLTIDDKLFPPLCWRDLSKHYWHRT